MTGAAHDAAYDEACRVCFMGLCDVCAIQQQTGTCCCGDDGGIDLEDDQGWMVDDGPPREIRDVDTGEAL